jgi:nucleotide-binding universal stress UspA family protein
MTTRTVPEAISTASVGEQRLPVIVGVDDTPDSALAVSWAVDEARSRSVALTIVRGYTWAMASPYMTADDRYIIGNLRADAEKIADHAIEQAHSQDPDLEIRVDIAEKYPPDLVTELSSDASLVVVGCTHRGPFARAMMGSVSSVVSAQSVAPVVVVCGPPPLTGEGRSVVVGLKPDETAQPVLAFAFDYAARHGLDLRAVLCWRPSGLADARPMPERAARWLAEAMAGWRERYPDVAIRAVVKRDEAAPALVEEAMNSSLLVVGRHGRTPRLGAILGSVSQSVIHHANRPVAIVPVAPPDER